MVGWGDLSSCSGLIDRVRRNEIIDVIVLPGKRFDSQDLMALAEIFHHHLDNATDTTNICQSIQASGHAVSNDALKVFGTALGNSSLEHLAIGDSSMGDDGVEALVNGILEGRVGTRNLSLKRLDLSFKGLGWKSLTSLYKVVDRLPSLEWLDLSRNAFLEEDSNEERITSFFPRITELNLSDCELGIMTLQKIIAQTKNCRTLRVSNNPKLRRMLFPTVATMLPGLEHLVATNCGITNIGGEMPLLSRCRILDVSENQLTVEDIHTLANLMPHLEDLKIVSNPTLGTEGTIAIAQHLGYIQSLDASASNCGIGGALALMTMEESFNRHCPRCLTSLRLFDSKLGSDGFHAMADLFSQKEKQRQHRFTMFDVGGNGADEAAVAKLIEAAAPSVNCLIVGGNQGGPLVEEAIRVAKLTYPQLDVARDVQKR